MNSAPVPNAPVTPPVACPPPNAEDMRKDLKEKMAKATEGAPAPLPPPPSDPSSAPPPGPKKMEIILEPADGAEMHLALMEFSLQKKEIDIANLRLSEAKISLDLATSRAQERQQNFKNILKKLGVPEGWSFNRKENGSYMFYPGPAMPSRGKK